MNAYDWLRVWKVRADDIYDFMRCPRILAFKYMRVKLRAQRRSSSTQVSAYTIGRIGEEAFTYALESNGVVNLTNNAVQKNETENTTADSDIMEPDIEFEDRTETVINEKESLDRISKKVISSIDPETLSKARDAAYTLVKSSVEGAIQLVKDLESKYGRPIVFSKAKVRSTILQAEGYPDFIIGFPDNRYVIVEVKNTKKVEKSHDVQIGYYIEASKLIGASILMERKVENRIEFEPVATSNIMDGILIYPRLKEIHSVSNFKLTTEIASNIMKVKYAVIKGLLPKEANFSYCNKCQFRNVCKTEPESKNIELDSIKMPIPFPITAALDISENYDLDLDLLFYGSYFRYEVPSRIILKALHQMKSSESMIYTSRNPDLLENITGIPRDKINDSLREFDRYWEIMFDMIRKEDSLSDIFNEALKIVGNRGEARELLRASLFNVQSTCIYPSDSLERVKESYKTFTKTFQ
ncbi:CRISPR-associated protein Cas4 [Saccharolobus caldissimus]|uniref:Uncharacterized protein n=1 Tax=Saccharolobus caldissimus TaxID=1702097 RepID=A0AAQ4CWS6_9CREN|nr:CRISPR-associated protein Cas4 [Saccharolobus caldissimus]BDC00258.1 hypothetical protein SACC_32740 [Saccharolobus caldissimus]